MIEFIERPRSTRQPSLLYEALMATAENGQAVVVPLDGRDPRGVHGRMRSYLRHHGYRLRYVLQLEKQRLICWTERITGTRPCPTVLKTGPCQGEKNHSGRHYA